MTETIDWKQKYEEMEKNYKDLVSVRIDSVTADIDDLNTKIQEHTKVNEDTRKEIEIEIERIKAKIREAKKMQEEIKQFYQKTEESKKTIRIADEVLGVLVEYKEFEVEMSEDHVYYITIPHSQGRIVFKLQGSRELTYTPMEGLEKSPNQQLKNQVQLDFSQLKKLCQQVLLAVPRPSPI